MDLPFIVALCPTFNHPELLANSVALWEMQDYPADRRQLLILDDGNAFYSQSGRDWTLFGQSWRAASLPEKYNHLASHAVYHPGSDALLVWEDDDLYLPGYVSAHARVLADRELSKPEWIFSDYPGHLVQEQTAGRFHSTLGFRRELLDRVGGWPKTKRADFDQQMIRALEANAASRGDPFLNEGGKCYPLEFVYRWHTGAHHGQSFMRGGDDETWYQRAGETRPAYVGKLSPRLDDRTRELLAELGRLR